MMVLVQSQSPLQPFSRKTPFGHLYLQAPEQVTAKASSWKRSNPPTRPAAPSAP
jgi:hypothetical protein